MATILKVERKSGVAYKAIIRIRGVTETQTFRKHGLAKQWADEREMRLREFTGRAGGLRTIGSLLAIYRERIAANLPYSTKSNTRNLLRLEQQTKNDVAGAADANYWVQLAQRWTCKPASRLHYLRLMAGALRKAERLEGLKAIDWDEQKRGLQICRDLHLIGDSNHRDRRPTENELAAIRSLADASPTLTLPLTRMIDFAIDSCMRMGEQGRITWGDYDATPGHEMVWIRDRKHPRRKVGNHWHVPMLGRCPQIIAEQRKLFTGRRDKDPIFPYKMESIAEAFDRCCERLGIKDLTWHDLRHEGISRLFEQGYQIQEVALISGHRDWKSLKIYTNIKPKMLHQGPAARRLTGAS